MKRPAFMKKTNRRIKKWRTICPDLTLQSTFIVGFPGETNEDFNILLEWLEEAKIERACCFKYEEVKGAAANDLRLEKISEEVKENRWHRFMAKQQQISTRLLKKKVGKRLKVLIDESQGKTAKGRSQYDAPEVDGIVHITSRLPRRIGEFVTVKIEQSNAYDLYGIAV